MQNAYNYDVTLEWIGRKAGHLRSGEVPPLVVSAPLEFSGQSGEWSPEHLLVASATSCMMTTFLAIAEISKLPVLSYRCAARGKLEKVPGEGYRFTEIVISPEICVPQGQAYRASRLVAKAEANCYVRNALRVEVRLEPRIIAEEPACVSG